ncbi:MULTISPECIES: hypothetical protein [Streptomyces]|uniref:Allene oxide cyclase barrel-like domain-containing protein n=1 Tax=Streptomyces plumbiresistens TaxID=511811 RepID=A0ABP7PYM1_9ACTN
MGPNDAQIVRVFSRGLKGPIADLTLNPNSEGEVVLEAEAGETLHDGGGDYLVTLVVRDLSDGTAIPAQVPNAPKPGEVKGRFRDPNWVDLPASFGFVMSSADLKNHRGHLVQAYGSVVYGNTKPGSTFAVSQTFQILP